MPIMAPLRRLAYGCAGFLQPPASPEAGLTVPGFATFRGADRVIKMHLLRCARVLVHRAAVVIVKLVVGIRYAPGGLSTQTPISADR